MSDAQSNYFYVNRALLQSDRWLCEKFTGGQAWVDLCGLAHHMDREIMVNGVLITVPRGHVAYSQLSLSQRWKWSRVKVGARMRQWVQHGDITMVKTRATNYWLIKIVKYDFWQGDSATDRTTDRTTDYTTDRTQSKNVKKVNNIRTLVIPVSTTTESTYQFIGELCATSGITNKVNKRALDIQVQRYETSFHLRTEVRNCITWLVDHGLKDITTMRLANWFKKAAEISKRNELKTLEWKQAKNNPYLAASMKQRGEKVHEGFPEDQSLAHFQEAQ